MNEQTKQASREWRKIERTGHCNRNREQTYDIMAGPAGQPENWEMVCDKATGANADLIAAAPDLLEACKALRDNWEHNLTDAMALVNAAISKAEGRQ